MSRGGTETHKHSLTPWGGRMRRCLKRPKLDKRWLNCYKFRYHLEPRDRNTLFLFCGRRADRIKGLVWEGDGWLLLYKRVELGQFSWPRSSSELHELSTEQFHSLMQGLEVVPKHPIRDVGDKPLLM